MLSLINCMLGFITIIALIELLGLISLIRHGGFIQQTAVKKQENEIE